MFIQTPLSPSPRGVLIEQITAQFSTPPKLREVARDHIQHLLDQRYPTLNFSAERVAIGTPMQAGGYEYRSLPDAVLERLAGAQPVRYVSGHHVAALHEREDYVGGWPPLSDIEQLVNESGAGLLDTWLARLQDWWREPVPVNMTRWSYLSDDLLEMLYDSQKPPGMSEQQFARIFPHALLRPGRPDSSWSLHGETLNLRTLHVRLQNSTHPAEMLPVLLLDHRLLGAELRTLLLFSPATGIHALSRLDDVEALIPSYLRPRLLGQPVEWFVRDTVGDPFDALAASYAERQWVQVHEIDRSVVRTVQEYQAMLDYITDPHRWFESVLTPVQRSLQDALPLWLIHASAADSLAYAQLIRALVEVQAAASGKTYLDGIAPIQAFAAQALRACLDKEPRTKGIKPDEIELTYNLVTAVQMPGGFVGGEVDRVTLSLTQLALENLGGFPHSPSMIRLKGAPAPGWLDAKRLQGCVTEVDIGQRYPDLLKQKLIDDPAEHTRRAGLFVQQLRVQLPLLALEMKIRREGGLTEAGYRLVDAVAQVNGQTAALWPLAFKATPTARADEVVNQYVIGPRNTETGPHLLYQPLFSPCLREFESLSSLFDAIKVPGALQDSVLAWMAPARQPVYANGGFAAPHVQRFLPGDEFSLPQPSAPAQLARQVLTGEPLHQVFVSTVDALVTLAQAQSVSNAERRWALLKEGGWLLFSTLLSFVRGGALAMGWMVQVAESFQHDVAALASNNPASQTMGMMDLLTNLVMILAHRASPHEPPAMLNLQHPAFAPAALPRPSAVVRGPIAEQARLPVGWRNARDTLTPPLQARLERMSLKAYPLPWPTELAGAQPSGRLKGLLQDTACVPPQWRALVRGHEYRVEVTSDSVRVTNADGTASGPWLKQLENGTWDVDLRLRLLGGLADTQVSAADNETRRVQLEQDYRQYAQRRETADRAIGVARHLITAPSSAVTERQRVTAATRYAQELSNKWEASQQELQCLKDLQALKPRPGYEREVANLLEGQILTTQLLIQHIREVAVSIHARLAPALEQVRSETEEEAESDINRQMRQTIIDGMRQLADINERGIRWTGQERDLLNELQRVPKYGRDVATQLREAAGKRPSVLELQSLQVTTLWGVAINVETPKVEDDFFHDLDDTLHRARWASQSQALLDDLASHSKELRIELLESFDRAYARTQDQIRFWRDTEPARFNLEYLEKLQVLFSQLHLEVQAELTSTLATSEATVPAKVATDARQKKIIRTRNQDLYVARVKVTPGTQPAEVAEVTDDQQTVVASFTQAEDGIWEPVRAPAAPRSAPAPSLKRLIDEGQGLRANVERAIQDVQKMASTANEPQSLQDILQQRADALNRCADRIQQRLLSSEPERLAATQKARAQTERDALRAAASRLAEEGLRARFTAIKSRLPTQSGLDVLMSHHEVRLFREGGRVAMKGSSDDWLQSYVVMDVHARQPWCYGHFHYQREAGPDDHFTAAHLKTPAQHRMGKQAQSQARARAFASMQTGQTGRVTQTLEIHRGEINLRMARRLFFDAPAWTGNW